MPRALVTNDDGIDSPGLHALAAAARDAGLEVVVALLSPVLELLRDAPPATVLSLNVPDRPADDVGSLRHARPARGGAVQARVDDVRDGGLRLREVEVSEEPEEGTDTAYLAAGHPTLTALRSVEADDGELVRKWLSGREG